MRPASHVSADAPPRELQFCVRSCAVFKFRPARACEPASPAAKLFAWSLDGRRLTPLGPQVREHAVALRVHDAGMGGLAEPGALIFFDPPRAPPPDDMLGHVVVLETAANELMTRRLLRGSRGGVFDLEGQDLTLRDMPLLWAAHISAIIPPHQARRIPIAGTSPAGRRCLAQSGQEES